MQLKIVYSYCDYFLSNLADNFQFYGVFLNSELLIFIRLKLNFVQNKLQNDQSKLSFTCD
ncbi:hypothetical protein EAH69_12725 [Faecalibacter macacae]|uniref:Uncharacterized protein n=1 Tax=Faecalibacter macacae TaxID=1859289 RepID=A0A3L9M0I7_9FLAO|nr:hypothetical protein EAH69_12725 [Faecalibacter macacae]